MSYQAIRTGLATNDDRMRMFSVAFLGVLWFVVGADDDRDPGGDEEPPPPPLLNVTLEMVEIAGAELDVVPFFATLLLSF